MAAHRWRRHALLPLLLLPSSVVHAKIVEGEMKLSSQETERYMAKFSFSPYQLSHIDGVFAAHNANYFDNHPHELNLCLYNEEAWQKFQVAMKKGSLCIERQQLASWKTGIHPTLLDRQAKQQKAGSAARDYEFKFKSTLTPPTSRAHYWFAVLMDCYLEEYDAHPPEMHFQITFTNGNSHLPADESGMTTINLLAFVGMAAYGAFYFGRQVARMFQIGQVHLITLVFASAYFLQTVAVLCELLHLRQYGRDGKGLRWRHTVFALDFLSGLLQSVSELLISVLLIALAFGWTLGLESQEPLEGLAGKIFGGLHSPGKLLRSFLAPSTLLLASIAASQLLLLALARRYEEDFNNFHDFEHPPGLALLGIRLALCALFLWALRRSRRVERQVEVLGFLQQLTVFGSIWFVGLPLLVALALVLPPYRRHQAVAGGSIFVQATTLAMLSALFREGSHYYKMSSLRFVGSGAGGGGGGFSMGSAFAPRGLLGKVAVD